MASKSEEKSSADPNSSILERFRSVTSDEVYFKILPTIGGVSYQLFSCNIMHPRSFSSLFNNQDLIVANSLWFNAHVGIGLYLYGSRHLQSATQIQRVQYSVFGSFLFNFGSVLFWATCKSILPRGAALRTLFGLGSGLVLLYIGKEYIDYIDKKLLK
ncbi:hypothetical protein SNE40_019048 [Patella caerulea]|uniref:Uncharacterized protein n=1 Tax=Patella caerulea TaxID=87958 RepID=A0AAN8J5Z6_PATCE